MIVVGPDPALALESKLVPESEPELELLLLALVPGVGVEPPPLVVEGPGDDPPDVPVVEGPPSLTRCLSEQIRQQWS